DVRADWKLVKQSIESKKAESSSDDIKREIKRTLDGVTSAQFPEKSADEIRQALKKVSPWSIAKTTGKSFIPNGEAAQAYNRMSKTFENLGLHILHVGELERFVPTVGNHGPAWVSKALEKDLLRDPELRDAREFVQKLVPRSQSPASTPSV